MEDKGHDMLGSWLVPLRLLQIANSPNPRKAGAFDLGLKVHDAYSGHI